MNDLVKYTCKEFYIPLIKDQNLTFQINESNKIM